MDGAPQERFDGGDPYIEGDRLQQLARRIEVVQKWLQKRNRADHPFRAFHAKIRLGVVNARLQISSNLPAELRVGFVQRDQVYENVMIRLSNASGSIQPDGQRDMRGIAIRVKVSDTEFHDFLLTNGPVSHARNGTEFVAFAEALAGSRLLLPFRLLFNIGPFAALRMLSNVRRYARANIDSLATETYWSRGALQWGPGCGGRLKLAPANQGPIEPPKKDHPEYLRIDLADRLRAGDVEFDLYFQPFVDETQTPIENAAKEWLESVSPPVCVGRLVLPRQDIDLPAGIAAESAIDRVAFNPWHTTEDFRPLGHINRARKVVYLTSASCRLEHRFVEEEPLQNRLFAPLVRFGFRLLNRFVPWHGLPARLGSLNLICFRHVLRRENLIDTEDRDAPPTPITVPESVPEALRQERAEDGSFNDLSEPRMGAEAVPGRGLPGATFGRNVPLADVNVTSPTAEPNPVEVSDRLLARRAFLPAKSLNLLAAAWIQFQVHDWVEHPRRDLNHRDSKPVEVPLAQGRNWVNTEGGQPGSVMKIAENVPRVTRDPRLRGIPVFENQNSPWWDAGQVYGGTPDEVLRHRVPAGRGGHRAELILDNGYLPLDGGGFEDTGFNENWWLGLSLLHTLFAREHNVIVAELRRAYSGWSEDHLFRVARLVIAALIAKIHSIEWTPAIVDTSTIEIALNGNWSGAPRDWISQFGIWLVESHALEGIRDTLPNHHGTPYSLTEEFVTIYRMHPLIPDDYRFLDASTGVAPQGAQAEGTFLQIQGAHTAGVMRQLGLANGLYSFGVSHPGAITLRNYPHHLRNFTRRNGERIDLAVIDLVRERMRGIPRYNEFRRLLHKPKVRDFDEITANAEWAAELKSVYRGDVEKIDTMVGLFAENQPEGFGFSDTAFRIFILMASRRLQSDRFFTVDYRPEVYSHVGLEWIERTGMKEIIERHCPDLARYLPRDASAFAPWRPFGQG